MIKSFNLSAIVFALLLSSFLNFSSVEAEDFDPLFGVGIKSSYTHIYPPSLSNDDWGTHTIVNFENGLYGIYSRDWKHESQAEQLAKQTTPIGKVNLTQPYLEYKSIDGFYFCTNRMKFCITHEPENYFFIGSVNLYISEYQDYSNLPKIVSMTENVVEIPGWFYSDFKYCYIIELDNGYVFSTKYYKTPGKEWWYNKWKEGNHVFILGTSKEPCLIILEGLTSTSIDEKDCFTSLLPLVQINQ